MDVYGGSAGRKMFINHTTVCVSGHLWCAWFSILCSMRQWYHRNVRDLPYTFADKGLKVWGTTDF